MFGSAAGTLVVDPGAVFNGLVVANAQVNDALVLGGTAASTLTGIGTAITGLNSIDFAAGSDWTIAGNAAGLAGGETIAGFVIGDTIDLGGVTATGATYLPGGTLALTTTSGVVDILLSPTQNYAGESFQVASDGHGGTDITVVQGTNVAPVFSGLVSGQTGLDFFSTHPFATATISDADQGVQDSITIVLDGSNGLATDANGTLSGTGLTKIGVGTYTLAAASPAALTAELQGLLFTPTRGEVGPGQHVTTTFKLTASQTADGSTLTTTGSASAIETGLTYTYGGNNNMFAWGNCGGYSAIVLGNGNDLVTIAGQDNVVGLGSGNDIVFGGSPAGGDFVALGGGWDNVAIFGTGDTVEAGNGNDAVSIGFTAGQDTVILGNGNDIVAVGGTGDTVILGNGNNWVGGTQGMAFISTGSGNDVIAVGGSYNTVNAGGGNNVIFGGSGHDTYVLADAGQGFDAITGFQLTNGDLLNVDAALHQAGWNGNMATLGNFLTVTDNGAGAALNIVPGGSGHGVAIAELYGANNLTLGALVAHSLIT